MQGHLEEVRRGPAFDKKLIWVILAFDVLILAFAAWTLNWSRGQHIANARMATHNLAQVLDQNILGTVNQIDLVLLSIKDEAERQGSLNRDHRIDSELQAQFARIRLLDALRVVDAEGTVYQGVPGPFERGTSLADRDYFQYLKANPQAGLYISRPLKGRLRTNSVIILARRLNHPDGRFGGIVYGALTLENLATTLASVDVGRKGSISLRGANRELLARYPTYPGFEKTIGDTKIDGDYLEAAESGRSVSHFTTKSWIDGQTRTYTFHRTNNPTFFILVGLAEEDYLQAWRKERLLALLAVTGLITLSLSIAAMGRSAWRRQAKVNALLEAQEAKFRLLAENASDVVWTADLQGRITYMSPVVLQQRGYTPEELVGLPFQDRQIVGPDPEPLQFVLDRVKGVQPGAQPFEGEWMELELPKKGGGSLKSEIRFRLVWDEHGDLQGFQGVTRDITERARMEAERDTLIRQLRLALAEVKNLEGMLPICGSCKKIRDDKGYWNQLETFITEHTDATFTHGVCPDCAETMRQELRDRRNRERRESEGTE